MGAVRLIMCPSIITSPSLCETLHTTGALPTVVVAPGRHEDQGGGDQAEQRHQAEGACEDRDTVIFLNIFRQDCRRLASG